MKETLENYIYDESNGLWYELQGDYYIPCFTLPEVETKDQMEWVRRMNNIRERVTEIINNELIYK